MSPDGVGSGLPLVYSKLSPGASTGCSPTTPGPRTSCMLPAAVGDPPVAAAQLHGLAAAVLDPHVIGPDIMVVGRRGVLFEVERA